MRRTIAAASALVIAQLTIPACSNDGSTSPQRVQPVYDSATGKLQLLKHDADGDGRVDTWNYLDGGRTIRIEIDRDEDGKIDQWQYYDRDSKISKIGYSLRSDGKEDAWTYVGPDGTISRVESSPRRDGKVSRIEHYEKSKLTSAEEDTDGNGRIDKWETYDGDRLATVAFDTTHRGSPDRRIVYGADESGRVEVDPQGTGKFVPVADPPRTDRSKRRER